MAIGMLISASARLRLTGRNSMRKRKVGKKFGRTTSQRKALLSGIAGALFLHGRVRTTEVRAKEARRVAERAITTAKNKTLAARRRLAAQVSPRITRTLMGDIAPRFTSRHGGYKRIVKIPRGGGDGAPVADLQPLEQ